MKDELAKELEDIRLELEILQLGVDGNERQRVRHEAAMFSHIREHISATQSLRARVAVLELVCAMMALAWVMLMRELDGSAFWDAVLYGAFAAAVFFWLKDTRDFLRRRKAALDEQDAWNAEFDAEMKAYEEARAKRAPEA